MVRRRGLPMSLATLPPGTQAILVSGYGYSPRRSRGESGRAPSASSTLGERLSAMGFIPGGELAVEFNHGVGPVIVRIRGARVAIGRGQAARMMVRPVLVEGAAGDE